MKWLTLVSATILGVVYAARDSVQHAKIDWANPDLAHGDHRFLEISRHDTDAVPWEEILEWTITGYSIGAKLLVPPKLHEFIGAFPKQQTFEKRKRLGMLLDKLLHKKLNHEESWFIYLRVEDSGRERYIKLWLGAHTSNVPVMSEDFFNDILCMYLMNRYDDTRMVNRGMHETDKVMERFGNRSGGNFKQALLRVEIRENHKFELRPGGCKIIDLPDSKKTLCDALDESIFDPWEGIEFPYYINKEYIGDGRLPVMNCIGYVMRVLTMLGAENNPAQWSYLNKKRGRVFEVSELPEGSIVKLDNTDTDQKFRIRIDRKSGNVLALCMDGAGEPPVKLTTFRLGKTTYVKEVYKLSLANPDDIGPRKKGVLRLWFWAQAQRSRHLFSPGRISIDTSQARNLYDIWCQPMVGWIPDRNASSLSDTEYRKIIQKYGPGWFWTDQGWSEGRR